LNQCNYFGPRNFGVFASYYTETLLYSNFRSLLFLRTCQAREIKGTWKNGFYSITQTSVTDWREVVPQITLTGHQLSEWQVTIAHDSPVDWLQWEINTAITQVILPVTNPSDVEFHLFSGQYILLNEIILIRAIACSRDVT